MTKKKPTDIYYNKIDDVIYSGMLSRRRIEAESHWETKYGLKAAREKNNREYLGKYAEEQLIDERFQELYIDNRQFTSVRTIVPFLTARITAAEVTPSDSDELSVQFAHDFEKALQKHAEKQKARAKVRLVVQDVLRGERVGILKWRYDRFLDTVILEHLAPNSVVIGKRGKQFEEPDYVKHTIERTVSDLVRTFPDKKEKILELFNIVKGTPSQMEELYNIDEEWLWVDIDGTKELVVSWSYNKFLFGKIKDPNFDENGQNIAEQSMMPFVFFNFINDGSGYVDQTSFLEQARHLQRNYNKRGQTIAENAKYGGTGVPIFAKGSINQKDVAKVRFSPIQRVLLDAADVSKAFTTWQSTPLPQYIVEDKYDDRNSIDNIWGTPNVFRGEQSKNNTLGQDVMIRNQAEGRLADPVDCIDDSMTRFYQIEAQMMYRYFTKEKYYKYLGSDGKLVSVVVSQKELAKNIGIEIDVKAGTSLPIDRAQKRATIIELLKMGRVGTLTAYKELNLFEDPEAAYKEFLLETTNPAESLAEVDKQVFDREASEDLQLVIGGETPDERDDISDEYVKYLNDWLLKDKFKLLQEKNPEKAAAVSQFIDGIIAKASRKADKMAMQPEPPMPMGAQPPLPEGMPPAPSMAGAMPSVPLQ